MSNPSDKDAKNGVSRRLFLHRAGAGAAAVATVGVTGVPAFAAKTVSGGQVVGETPTTTTGTHQGYRNIEEVWGPNYHLDPSLLQQQPVFAKPSGLLAILRWNRIAIDASGLDHTPVAAGDPRHFGEQLGPCRASRAMGIVHVAMFLAGSGSSGRAFVSVAHPARASAARADITNAMTERLMFSIHLKTISWSG